MTQPEKSYSLCPSFVLGVGTGAALTLLGARWLLERLAGACIDAAGWREDYERQRAAK